MRMLASIMLLLSLIACTGASNSASVVGTWVLDGPTPSPSATQRFTFLKLAFSKDGALKAEYLPSALMLPGGMSSIAFFKALAPKTETLAYEVRDGNLEIRYGSSVEKYTYELRDGRLYLTPPANSLSNATTIFKGVNE